jgi:hypothetical protein
MTHAGIAYMIESALVKGVIYDVIFKVMRSLTITQAVELAIVVVLAVVIIKTAFSRSEYQD